MASGCIHNMAPVVTLPTLLVAGTSAQVIVVH